MHKFTAILSGATMLVATLGTATSAQADDKYLAEIFVTAANFCPRGTMTADGEIMSITGNEALFSLMGRMYGGDGRTTFALPDMRPLDADGNRIDFKTMRHCVVTQGVYPSRS